MMKFPNLSLVATLFSLGRAEESGVRDLNGVHRELEYVAPSVAPSSLPSELKYIGCPDPNADGNFPASGYCAFPIFVSGFVDGLPEPAVLAHQKNNINTGRLEELKLYRLDDNSDCSSPPASIHNGGANIQAPSDDGFSWEGNFILFRPPGQISNDPGGFDVDGKGGIFDVNGKVTFEDTHFTIKSYKGKTPVDICAILA